AAADGSPPGVASIRDSCGQDATGRYLDGSLRRQHHGGRCRQRGLCRLAAFERCAGSWVGLRGLTNQRGHPCRECCHEHDEEDYCRTDNNRGAVGVTTCAKARGFLWDVLACQRLFRNRARLNRFLLFYLIGLRWGVDAQACGDILERMLGVLVCQVFEDLWGGHGGIDKQAQRRRQRLAVRFFRGLIEYRWECENCDSVRGNT